MVGLSATLEAFVTVAGTIFVAELTDKDAMLLLTLATRNRAWFVFAAGSIAFTVTSAIIVLVGSVLAGVVPVLWIRAAGGAVMIAYAVWETAKGVRDGQPKEGSDRSQSGPTRNQLAGFLMMVLTLAGLDLAGDATEVLTVVFVARFQSILLVFLGAVTALVAASALETLLGNRFGRLLSAKRLRYFSIAIFLVIGSVVLLTVAFPL
jgi:putative Ca2+/H+ antiporter (TMEM165/GDT1 family)